VRRLVETLGIAVPQLTHTPRQETTQGEREESDAKHDRYVAKDVPLS
jgi:hypothetical protein